MDSKPDLGFRTPLLNLKRVDEHMIEVDENPFKSCSLRSTHEHQNEVVELLGVVRPRLSLSEFYPFSG